MEEAISAITGPGAIAVADGSNGARLFLWLLSPFHKQNRVILLVQTRSYTFWLAIP